MGEHVELLAWAGCCQLPKKLKAVIADAEAELAGKGRLVIRASGTEPLIRVMAEGDDAAQVERVVDTICDAVKAAA